MEAQRNVAHFLELISDARVKIDPLITHRFPFGRALDAYDLILKGKEPVIGVLLDWWQSFRAGTAGDFWRRIGLYH
jgi:threonine dehydrogenase-like Zn-dependent dehydrogenase